MATYGLTTATTAPGYVSFTGFTPTLGTGQANVHQDSGRVQFNGIGQDDHRFAQIFRKDAGAKIARQLWLTLTGAVAGGTATASQKRSTAVQGGQSGLIAIETRTLVNRVTTAADVTAFTALFNRQVYPATYAPDLSGNGGGGKLGLF